MTLPNKVILKHEKKSYDPAKAHEYYMRTRKLKGRKGSSGYTVTLDSGRTIKLSAKQLTEQKAYASKRIGEIRGRLQELNVKLAKAMRSAKAKKVNAKREAAKPATTAEKSKVARASRQYRDKHQQELATKAKRTVDKKTPTNSDPVEELETQIDEVKSTLKAAVARQRALVGASKNR